MALRLRTSTVRSKGRTYAYFQLVRAVRRAGRPTHEVVAHLGRLPQNEVEAIRRGLASLGRLGSGPENAEADPLIRLRDVSCLGALRYLDLVVVREAWRQWGLDQFFAEHLPTGSHQLSPADVIFVMVANRCVAPCSKLRLTEWTPTTALPEILHFRPQQLHNTRLHRALDRLKDIEPKLTRFLVTHPARRTRPDSVVYLDLTSTWFEGHGGTLGLRGRCKDGAIHRHAIQIALAVDNRGIPLRWEVLSGKVAEVDALPSWLPALAEHSELSDLPIVFDRGLTSEENLSSLITAKRSFVTCARESLVEKWSLGVDLAALSQLPLDTVPTRDTLTKLGLKSTDDEDIYHVDQGARAVPSMETIDKLRVVPYFRPSLFVRNRESLDRVCLNVEGKVKAINEELKTAKRDRKEESTRKKITELLGNFGVAGEFDFAIHELSLAGARRPIRSFQVALTRRSTPSSRRLNCGWMMLLASPTDERPALDLIRQYHHKEVVEHSFGIIKSVVELRPIHHQTDQKIRAHVTICVLALLLARAIELRLREAGITDAIDRVFEALDPCRLQILSHKGQRPRYAITQLQPRQGQLLKALGLTHWSEPAALSGLQPRAAFLA